jgi:hypothetical protein
MRRMRRFIAVMQNAKWKMQTARVRRADEAD